jgi:hypothetical protein
MAHLSVPFVVGFILAFVVFALIGRTGRLSPKFSTVAAAIMLGPILVGLGDLVATAILVFINPPPEQDSLLVLSAAGVAFSLITFAPTVLVLVPLLAFYLVRAFRKERMPSAAFVSTIGGCCIIAQIEWLYSLASAID